jgi:hypothetical protein
MKNYWYFSIILLSITLIGCSAETNSEPVQGIPTTAATATQDQLIEADPKETSALAVNAIESVTPTSTPEQTAAASETIDVPVPQTGTLQGVVLDDDEPLIGAIVRIRGTDTETVTDKDGSFEFPNLTLSVPISVTAWLDGYYVRAATAHLDFEPVSIEMERYHTEDNLDYRFASAEECGECHAAFPEWQVDAHGSSATNQRFLTIYTGEDVHGNEPEVSYDETGRLKSQDPDSPYYGPGYKLDNPNRTGNCAACHTPMVSPLETTNTCGWSGCHTNNTAFYSDQVPYGISPTDAYGIGLEGINCDFCHKIGAVDLDPDTGLPWSARPGISSFRVYRPGEGHDLFMGTFDDVPGHDTYLPLLEQSEYCAPCHYGVFGGVSGSHNVGGGVTVYNSFGEWKESDWSDPETGMSCQQCHMPTVDYEYFVFPDKGGLQRDPDRIHNHQMPGVNDLDLMENAVTMETAVEVVDGDLVVDVSINNDQTGHHVPTGSPYRHMILLVSVEDSQDQEIPLKEGATLPAWIGDLEGEPGTYFAKILKDEYTGEYPTAAYWRSISLVEDTRIGAFETVENQFVFPVDREGSYKVHVQLLYRRAYQQLMEQKGWTDADILMEETIIEVNQ